MHHDPCTARALEHRHLDVGRGERVDQSRARHPRHLGYDHAGEREHRKRENTQRVENAIDAAELRERRHPSQMHCKNENRQ